MRLAARVGPAGVFVWLMLLRRDAIERLLGQLAAASSSEEALRAGLMLVHQLLVGCFCLFIAAQFVRRLPVMARAGGPGAALLAFAGTCGTAPLALMAPTTSSIALVLTANVVTALGLLASCYCVAVLGRSFGIRACARALVTRGPYASVRHPLYVAESVAQLGIVMLALSPLAMASFSVYLLLQYRRALLEEHVLTAAFPDYREYQARTARFVPGLI